jgi:hypothetical protein
MEIVADGKTSSCIFLFFVWLDRSHYNYDKEKGLCVRFDDDKREDEAIIYRVRVGFVGRRRSKE